MNNTKEKILLTALRLFARDGYEAVSVSQISGELGMTKSALYKHYQNKRALFDSILARMEQMDAENAQQFELPEGTAVEMPAAYEQATAAHIQAFTEAQFRYWTEQEFPALFRRLLTIEQYRNDEMGQLYQQYLAGGCVGYMADLFRSMTADGTDAEQLALEFYAPMYLLYSLYDSMEQKETAVLHLREHMDRFFQRMKELPMQRL